MSITKHEKQLISSIRKDIFSFGSDVSIDNLEIILKKAADIYYNSGDSILSDAEYDILLDFLRKRNPKSSFLKQVGAPLKNKKVKLDYYLGSMDKIKPPSNKIDIWLKKYPSPYYLSDKLDGISGLLIYDNNKINLYTRGTATEGMDITNLIKYLKLPEYSLVIKKLEKLKISGIKKQIALRGEIIMSKKNFEKYSKDFKNPRNLVAGLVNSKQKNPIISKDLDFVIYQVVDPNLPFSQQMTLIKNLGFKTVYYQSEKELNYKVLSQILKNRKNYSPFEVDGIIVTNNQIHPENTSGNPDYAFAFKELLEDMFKPAIIQKIEWNISKGGKITPTVLIKPIELGGVTISRLTAFNAKYVKDNGLGKGAKIQITRSGDVIPYIVKVLKKVKPDFPDIPYKWNETNVDIITTADTNEQDIKRIYFFFKTLDLKGFGMKLIQKLYQNNFNSINKILNMTVEDFLKLPNIKQKSADNFYNEINTLKSKTIPIEKFVLATNSLGDNFGSRKAKLIFKMYPDILTKKLNSKWIDKLIEIEGIENKTALQIIDNWNKLLNNYNNFKKILKFEIPKKNSTKTNKSTKSITNKNWVLSGFRDKDLQDKIEKMGGNVSNTISKNTNILVIKDESVLENPTSKVEKAKKLGITIIVKSNVDKYLK